MRWTFDGTLAHYGPWKGIEHIGDPVEAMQERVKWWLAKGQKVKIFTARANCEEAIPFIEDWCLLHLGQKLPVTATKDYGMIELWDDRCIQVILNFLLFVNYDQFVVIIFWNYVNFFNIASFG